jgi:hypothetical protein
MSAAQQGEHGEHATVHVRGGLQAELAEQLGAGRLDGPLADAELAGDTGIGATLGHQGKDVSFAWGEVSERGVGVLALHQPGHDGGGR